MAESGKKKSHRDRKNPHAAEEWAARKKTANAARPKQVAVPLVSDDYEYVSFAFVRSEAA